MASFEYFSKAQLLTAVMMPSGTKALSGIKIRTVDLGTEICIYQ